MTTVEIKAAKVAKACKQALVVAEYDLVQNNNTTFSTEPWSAYYHAQGQWRRQREINWLKDLLVAANASEGVVKMSVEAVTKIGEWL